MWFQRGEVLVDSQIQWTSHSRCSNSYPMVDCQIEGKLSENKLKMKIQRLSPLKQQDLNNLSATYLTKMKQINQTRDLTLNVKLWPTRSYSHQWYAQEAWPIESFQLPHLQTGNLRKVKISLMQVIVVQSWAQRQNLPRWRSIVAKETGRLTSTDLCSIVQSIACSVKNQSLALLMILSNLAKRTTP